MTYEIAIQKLSEIVEKLSSQSLPLLQATQLFEEGLDLIKFCNQQLKTTKGKILEIKQELDKLKLEESE